MSPRWDKRLRLPKSDGGATICEKHEFIEAHFRDPEMSWEVDQAVTQAKDDGKRMEARIQELGEEANNLEEALDEMTAHRDRLASDLQATRAELERVRIAYLRQIERRASKHVTEWMGVIRSMGCWDSRSYQGRRLTRITNVRDACRAALATMEPKA